MKRNLSVHALVFSLLCTILSCAPQQKLIPPGKAIYVMKDDPEMNLKSDTSRYSYHRMAYSDNIVVFWEKGFGKDPSKAPDLNGKPMTFDVQNLLKQTERFYTYYRDTLKFLDVASKADTFRMMIVVKYSEEGTAYGGDYGGVIGAAWATPVRLQDIKLNALAHELGHSFQAQTSIDRRTWTGGGGIMEIAAQWLLWQVNPDWVTDENYHWKAYMKETHLSLFHYRNMYRAPYMLEYWSDKHGPEIISKLWGNGKKGEDIVQTYQRLTSISQEQFNTEVFDASRRYITYDYDRVRDNMKPYANKHFSVMDTLEDGWYKIADTCCLQNYGYNGIQLVVPEGGSQVSIQFEGLETQTKGGWRYGLVSSDKDGNPTYSEMYADPKGTINYQVPSNTAYLWLVVTGVPDEHSLSDKQTWPYKIKLKGTDLFLR